MALRQLIPETSDTYDEENNQQNALINYSINLLLSDHSDIFGFSWEAEKCRSDQTLIN
jgi:hypothetical protein